MADTESSPENRVYTYRRHLVRAAQAELEKGVVGISEDSDETGDYYRAAQSIMITELQKRLLSSFEAPRLDGISDFFVEFATKYIDAVLQQEKDIWYALRAELDAGLKLKENDESFELTPLEAAHITMAFNEPEEIIISSRELFLYLPKFALVLYQLLENKYGDNFSVEVFITACQKTLPTLLRNFIAMAGRTSQIAITTFTVKEDREKPTIFDPTIRFEKDYFEVDDSDVLKVKPAFFNAVKQHIHDQQIESDLSGRTADRGCPFLHSENPEALIAFAVNEFVNNFRQRSVS